MIRANNIEKTIDAIVIRLRRLFRQMFRQAILKKFITDRSFMLKKIVDNFPSYSCLRTH